MSLIQKKIEPKTKKVKLLRFKWMYKMFISYGFLLLVLGFKKAFPEYEKPIIVLLLINVIFMMVSFLKWLKYNNILMEIEFKDEQKT